MEQSTLNLLYKKYEKKGFSIREVFKRTAAIWFYTNDTQSKKSHQYKNYKNGLSQIGEV